MIKGFFAAWREVRMIVLSVMGIVAWALWKQRWWLSGLSIGLLGWISYFFRDPKRSPVRARPDLILAPADGRITDIERIDEPAFIQGPACRISLFLSLFDVHVQRAPYQGQVRYMQYQPGQFAPAFLKDTQANEANVIGLATPKGPIMVKQIAGILARRIICWATIGDKLATGERLGLIKFGSRVDLLLPPEVEVLVTVGQQIYGGQTPVAKWK